MDSEPGLILAVSYMQTGTKKWQESKEKKKCIYCVTRDAALKQISLFTFNTIVCNRLFWSHIYYYSCNPVQEKFYIKNLMVRKNFKLNLYT